MIHVPDNQQKGIVFNVQKYSLHDGDGIRTIVFLKGCSLLCRWCSNPESQKLLPQIACNSSKCLTFQECSRCKNICSDDALSADDQGRVLVDYTRCTNCLKCTEACPTDALNTYGYETSVADVLKRVEEDGIFYLRSGGGLTLSGGEPLLQNRFTISILREARKRRIDTCIETSGNVSWQILSDVAKYLNQIYFDIKVMDTDKHKEYTGFDNHLIRGNLLRLADQYPDLPITVRTPVIPGLNDTKDEIKEIVSFIKGWPNISYELLEYHRMGTPKYSYMGREYPMTGAGGLSRDLYKQLKDYAKKLIKE